jgi:hypothetical protein
MDGWRVVSHSAKGTITVDSTMCPDFSIVAAFSGLCVKAYIVAMSATSNIKWTLCGLAA